MISLFVLLTFSVGWSFLFFSDRFVDLSPNSVEALLKVSVSISIFLTLELSEFQISFAMYSVLQNNDSVLLVLAWWRKSYYWIWKWNHQVRNSPEDMIRFPLHLWHPFGSSNILLFCAFSLVGILPNRIIQPIAEHSEYAIERLGMGLLSFQSTNSKTFVNSWSITTSRCCLDLQKCDYIWGGMHIQK